MIQKWDIKPDPNAKNKDRHKLLVKGEMKDIFFIVKKLGSVCSRPQKTKGDFNFTIYLSKMDTSIMQKLKDVAAELSSPEGAAKKGPDSFEKKEGSGRVSGPPGEKAARASVVPADKAKISPPPSAAASRKDEGAKPEEKTRQTLKPPESAPAQEKKAPASAPSTKEEAGKAPEKKAGEPKETEGKPVPPKVPSMGVSVPSRTARMKKEETGRREKEEAAKEPAAAAEEKIKGRLLKTKWSLELPLNPMFNFDNLVSGSHNRFAHAAAMAVIDNPGMMYNPLLIFGIPGTGKTHFANAMAYGLARNIGQEKVFVTDGIRFSKGVAHAIKDNFTDKLKKMLESVQVLIMDDIHLLMLTEKSKSVIAGIFDEFMESNKQLVFTSLYPPKSLEGLEDNLGFQISQGWMVDLKIPGAESYLEIIRKLMEPMEIELSDEEINFFFISKMMDLGYVGKTLRQVKKLEKFLGSDRSHGEYLKMMFGDFTSSGEMPSEEDYSRAESFSPAKGGNWFKWGFFYPKGGGRDIKWLKYMFHETAREAGIPVEWDDVFTEEYDSDQSFGVPFKIGETASGKKVNGAVVLGPQSSSALGSTEEEFRHLTGKIADSYSLKMGWVSYGQIKDREPYIKLLMDLI